MFYKNRLFRLNLMLPAALIGTMLLKQLLKMAKEISSPAAQNDDDANIIRCSQRSFLILKFPISENFFLLTEH